MKSAQIGFIMPVIVSFVSFLTPVSFSYAEAVSADSLNDHKAQIFKVEGVVKVLKTSGRDWLEAAQGMVLEAGDQVLTGKASHVELSYDDHFLNIARIDENTKAEFRSIEPTDLHLEDGSVFSALDGLKGMGYQISTPTAVAAVRGTHFDVKFDAVTRMMDVAVIPDTREHVSHLEITTVLPDGAQGPSVTIAEGQQIGIEKGQASEPKAVDPGKVEASHEQFGEMMQGVDPGLRQEGEALMVPAPNKKDESSNKAEAVSEKKDDGRNKQLPPGGGNGGDNGGGGNGPTGGNDSGNGLTRDAKSPNAPAPAQNRPPVVMPDMDKSMMAKMDAVVDSLIPREDIAPPAAARTTPEGSAVNNRADASKAPNNPDSTQPNQPAAMMAPAAQAPRTDLGRMMEFLNTGGALDFGRTAAGGANIDPTHLGVNMNGIFNNLGFDKNMSAQLTTAFTAVADQMHPADAVSRGVVPAAGLPGGAMPVGMLTPEGGVMPMGTNMPILATGIGTALIGGDLSRSPGEVFKAPNFSHDAVTAAQQTITNSAQAFFQNNGTTQTFIPAPSDFIQRRDGYVNGVNAGFLAQLFSMLNTTSPVNSTALTYLSAAINDTAPSYDQTNNAGLSRLTEESYTGQHVDLGEVQLKVINVHHIELGADDKAGVQYQIIDPNSTNANHIVQNGAGNAECTTISCSKA